MKLNNTFKIVSWIILLASHLKVFSNRCRNFLHRRCYYLATVDRLVLAPTIQDAKPFGSKLQNSIESLRDPMQHLMFTVQTQNQSVNINNYPIPPSDREVTERQRKAEELLGKESLSRSLQNASIPQDPEINHFFNLRRSLETELKPIESASIGFHLNYRRFSWSQTTQFGPIGLLLPNLVAVMTDLYAICTAAIHGDDM